MAWLPFACEQTTPPPKNESRQRHLDVIGKVEVIPKAKASAKAGVELGSFLII